MMKMSATQTGELLRGWRDVVVADWQVLVLLLIKLGGGRVTRRKPGSSSHAIRRRAVDRAGYRQISGQRNRLVGVGQEIVRGGGPANLRAIRSAVSGAVRGPARVVHRVDSGRL